jgi:hypothetical protein
MMPKYLVEAALILGAAALAAVLFTSQPMGVAAGTFAIFLAAATRIMPALLRLQSAALAIRAAAGDAAPTFALADVTIDSSDFVKANGDTNGRKVTMAQKTGVTVDSSGTANHIALCNSGDSSLRYVTTCTSQVLTAGNTVTFPAWDIEIADPT